jgi:S1-C subfamily serine protease
LSGAIRTALRLLLVAALAVAHAAQASDAIDTIARVKRSVVAVGTFARERNPNFAFRGTGFAVERGNVIVTNAHVLPEVLDVAHNEALAILLPGTNEETARVRGVTRLAVDPGSDLALLRLDGEPLPPLAIGDWSKVREGPEVLITGFPIGPVLGPFPVTHRGMISAITPIAIPQRRAGDLNPALIRRLASGTFPVFQLDATAYPGNSGSPIYDPGSGSVLGVVNMVFVKGTKEAVLTEPSGITYAVPSGHLAALLETLSASVRK